MQVRQRADAIFSEENHAGIFHDAEEFYEVGTDAFALLATSEHNSWARCGHGAVRVEGIAQRLHGFVMTRCKQADCVRGAEEWRRVNQHLFAGDTELTPDALKNIEGDNSAVLQRPRSAKPQVVINATEGPATECMSVQDSATSRFPADMERAWNRRAALTNSRHSQYFGSVTRVVLMAIVLLIGFRVLEL